MEKKMAQITIYLGADRIISACGLTTRENMESIGGGKPGVATFRDPALCDGELTAGRIDLMPMSESTFKSLPAHTFREVITLSRQQLGLACNKSVPDEVIAKLQARLDELIADGTQQRIFDRYDLIRP